MPKLWVSVLIAIVSVFLSACATGPKFNTVESGFSPLPADKARIFFYRTATLGGGIQPEIKLNGTVVGKAQPRGIFFVDRDPGNMEVVTGSEVEKRLTFTAAAGETRYVRMAVGFGVLVYRIIPELVGEFDAKNEIADLAYTGSGGLREN